MDEELENNSEAYKLFLTEKDYSVNPCSEVRYLYKEYTFDSILEIESEIYYEKDGIIKEKFIFDYKSGFYISINNKNCTQNCKHTFLSDENGRLIKEIDTDELGNTNWIVEYNYDKSGRLVSQKTVFQDSFSEIKKVYDDKGNVAETIFYKNGCVGTVSKYKHIDNFEVEYNLDSEGHQIQRWETTYSQNNLLVEIVEFDKFNHIVRTDRQFYNSHNELIMKERIIANDILIEKTIKEYDLENRLLKKTVTNFKNGSLVFDTICEYEYQEI